MLMDFTIGRKGFASYLKAVAGSNIVKIVPANGSASAERTTGKRLKVVCGANTSYLEDSAWIGDKTPLTLCEVRVSPNNTVKPNIGAIELLEALNRVLPFTARDDTRPVLQCVLFRVKDGKLTLVSADGFRLAVVKVDFDGDDGEVLINREDLRGIANALRHAKRVRVSLEKSGETLDGMRLILDTELIRYNWQGISGNFPDYEKLIPSQPRPVGASFDTTEAIKAVSSLKVLAYAKSYPIDLTIGNGKLIMSNPDDKGQTEIPADTEGEVKVRLDGSYLAEALRACGGMVDFKVIDGQSPMLFTVDGYELVTMPMMTEPPKPKTEATEPVAQAVAEAEAVAEAHAEAEAEAPTEKPKRKRSKAKEPVAV
jgi:hypothetical protein